MASLQITRQGDLIDSLRTVLRSCSVFAICSMSVAFQDQESVDIEEFQKGIQRYNELCLLRHKIHLMQYEIVDLFSLFEGPDGKVSVREFLSALRPPMSLERKELVVTAFKKLDTSGAGSVSVSEVREEYTKTVTFTETVVASEVKIPVSRSLLLPLPFLYNPLYKYVTLNHFLDFYSGVSATIHQDALFDIMMRRAWGM